MKTLFSYKMALLMQFLIILMSTQRIYSNWRMNSPYHSICYVKSLSDINLTTIFNPNNVTSLRIICVGDSVEKKKKFPSEKLTHLLQLEILNIDNCMLSEIESGAFKGINNVQVIQISKSNYSVNETVKPNVPEQLLCELNDLFDFSFTGYNLKYLDGIGCGENNTCCLNLQMLDLHNNRIAKIRKKDLTHFSQLKMLRLQFNYIQLIEDGAFDNLPHLSALNLAHNKLTQINETLFRNKSSLLIFLLDYNQLTYLPVNNFRNLLKIQYLSLKYNKLFFNNNSVGLFANLNSLSQLDLRGNQIDYLPSDIFANLKSLQKLDLSSNLIQHITDKNFLYSSSLKWLSLSNNTIATISQNAFRSLINLTRLYLDSNNITDIVENSFYGLQQLESLDLQDNRIKLLRKTTFGNLSNLNTINLHSNQISVIEDKTFDVLININYLKISSNKIKEMKSLFKAVKKVLLLGNNEIEDFYFSSINFNLKVIDLTQNKLRRIVNSMEAVDFYQLRYFFAVDNQLQDFKVTTFPSTIKIINLSYNNITKVNFDNSNVNFFPQLQLNLDNNFISEILAYDFIYPATNPNIKNTITPIIKLTNNPLLCSCNNNWLISRIKSDKYILTSNNCEAVYGRIKKFSSQVEVKKLKRNDLLCENQQNCPEKCHCFYNHFLNENILDCFNISWAIQQHIEVDIITNYTFVNNITQMFFDGNLNFGSVVRTLLANSQLFVLHTLFMNTTGLATIDENVFKNTPNLKELHLQENNLSKINGFEFRSTLQIEKLFLHQNKLKYLSADAFQNLTQLQLLTLHQNQLMHLNFWTLAPHLSKITFSGNPFKCNCEFTPKFQEWITKNLENTVPDFKEIECTFPPLFEQWFLKNRPIKFPDLNLTYCDGTTNQIMNFNNSRCNEVIREVIKEVNKVAIVVAPTVTIATFIIIIILFAYLYSVEMKVMLYSRYGVRLFYNNKAADTGKIYDAFISYANEDDEWVMEILVPKLHKYNLCLHQRDFPAGGFIVDSIVHAVENSCRTIIILTPNYLQSQWCKFEFDTAHVQSLEDRCKRLVVVFFQEVNKNEMDKNVQAYLKTNTYLDVKDSLFWEKLKYALPDLRQENETVM